MGSKSSQTNDSNRPITVAIGIVLRGNQVLICQRKTDAVLGGYWEFPGGKIEPGETPAQAVIRELKEELDIVVTAGATLPTIEHTYDHGVIRLSPIHCTLTAGEPRAIGCQRFQWVECNRLSEYTFPAANAPLLQLLARASTLHPPV
ncbi:MAG: 8-oxo-dGTP diphosphatase MutT [Burkholderiales bacterium]|nr:8-oxo-dGTP diphosphatase MutT [Phycisphaerae bacterium]